MAIKQQNLPFHLDRFIAECKSRSATFELRQFLQFLDIDEGLGSGRAVTITQVVSSLRACGISDCDEHDVYSLLEVMFGTSSEAGLIIIHEMASASHLGVCGIEYLLSYYQLWKELAIQFLARIDNGEIAGHGIKFNQDAFTQACLEVSPEFSLADFLQHLVLSVVENGDTLPDESSLSHVFHLSGLPVDLSDVEYEHLVCSLTSSRPGHLAVFAEWARVLCQCDVDTFIRISMPATRGSRALTQRQIQQAVDVFHARIPAGTRIDVPSFQQACEAKSGASFSPARFLSKLSSQGHRRKPERILYHVLNKQCSMETCAELLPVLVPDSGSRVVFDEMARLLQIIGVDAFIKNQ